VARRSPEVGASVEPPAEVIFSWALLVKRWADMNFFELAPTQDHHRLVGIADQPFSPASQA
jgi:hypothetical protein